MQNSLKVSNIDEDMVDISMQSENGTGFGFTCVRKHFADLLKVFNLIEDASIASCTYTGGDNILVKPWPNIENVTVNVFSDNLPLKTGEDIKEV